MDKNGQEPDLKPERFSDHGNPEGGTGEEQDMNAAIGAPSPFSPFSDQRPISFLAWAAVFLVGAAVWTALFFWAA